MRMIPSGLKEKFLTYPDKRSFLKYIDFISRKT